MNTFLPIDEPATDGTTAKSGDLILLLSAADTYEDHEGEVVWIPPRVALGKWWPEGDAWVDQYGTPVALSQELSPYYTLAVTGVWESERGWFEPGEVTHWAPLPALPKGTDHE